MRRLCCMLILLAVVPGAATAQSAPAPIASAQPGAAATGDPAQPPIPPQMQAKIVEMRATFSALNAQSQADQAVLRRDVLAVLTPAQRSWIGATIGALAVAANPNGIETVAQIDAALSPAQKQTVTQLVQAEASRSQAMFEHAMAESQREFLAQLPPNAQAGAHGAPIVGTITQGPPGASIAGAPLNAMRYGRQMLQNQSAGALLVEILLGDSMASLHPEMGIIPK